MITTRMLGLGFGDNNHFYLRLNEPNKLMINKLPFPPNVLEKLRETFIHEIQHATETKTIDRDASYLKFDAILKGILEEYYPTKTADDIEKMVSGALALIMPDLLVDINITRLNEHILPKAMQDAVLKSILGAGLDKFFVFDAEGRLYFATYPNSNSKPIYRRDSDFSYKAMQNESDEIRQLAQKSQRFLKSLIVSKYIKDYKRNNNDEMPVPIKILEAKIQAVNEGLLRKEISEEDAAVEISRYKKLIEGYKDEITREQLAVIFHDLTGRTPPGMDLSRIKAKIKLEDNDVYAYLVPAIMDRLNDADLQQAAVRMAQHLAIRDFKPIGVKNYEKLQLKLQATEVSITNQNKRSLQFFPIPHHKRNDNGLRFRDKIYQLQHTHIHFENAGEEKEFVIKDKSGKTLQFDGEVHSVFEYTPAEKEGKVNRQKRLIAVHYPLKIVAGDDDIVNPELQKLLNEINEKQLIWEAEVKKWEDREYKNDGKPKPLFIPVSLDFANLFLKSLNEQSEKGELLHHSWASWRSKTHGFNSGLRFVVSLQPINVSPQQYARLKGIFGEMRKDLTEEEILDPIDRKADWREERTYLQNPLANLASASSTPTMRG